jgi:hypothetical protein
VEIGVGMWRSEVGIGGRVVRVLRCVCGGSQSLLVEVIWHCWNVAFGFVHEGWIDE